MNVKNQCASLNTYKTSMPPKNPKLISVEASNYTIDITKDDVTQIMAKQLWIDI